MSAGSRKRAIQILALSTFLSAGKLSAEPGSYWENTNWNARLLDSIGAGIRWAEDDDLFGFPPSTATVEFDYIDGKLSNAQIVASTGSEHLDEEVVTGINNAHPPSVYGQEHPPAHHFHAMLDIEPNELQFRAYVHSQISDKLHLPTDDYPESATRVYVDAQYLDGRFVDIKTDGLDGSETVQSNVAKVMQDLSLPSAPQNLTGKKLEFTLGLCVTRSFKDCLNAPRLRKFGKLSLVLTPQ